MTYSCRLIVAFPLACFSHFAWAGESRPLSELKAREAKFSADSLTLKDSLKELQDQTGNALKDIRKEPTNLKLTLKPGTFWQTLDAIGKETGIGFSAYQADGGVALVDTPYRPLQTHYSGMFRFAFKRASVSKDEETQAHTCHVTLDAAWEPRFKALYLNLDRAEAGKEKVERDSARPVSGTSATEIELRMKAPNRKAEKIDSLKGAIRVVGVPKMLEFAFPLKQALKPAEQEGVKVSVIAVTPRPNRWTVDLLVEYPNGAIVELESFQNTWMNDNRIWLAWTDAKTGKSYELEPLATGQARDTKIRFEFPRRDETPVPPMGADVTLRYRTPNRVVAFTVPFEFRDLPLP